MLSRDRSNFPIRKKYSLQRSITFGVEDFLDADLPWIRALCHTLEKKSDPIAIVSFLLMEESDFAELWTGEINDKDVRRVMDVIGATEK